jgi:hypothetical protein
MNRYAFGPGNPLTYSEIDGHSVAASDAGCCRRVKVNFNSISLLNPRNAPWTESQPNQQPETRRQKDLRLIRAYENLDSSDEPPNTTDPLDWAIGQVWESGLLFPVPEIYKRWKTGEPPEDPIVPVGGGLRAPAGSELARLIAGGTAAKAGATRATGTALELSTYPASRGFFGGFSTTETLTVGTKIDRFGFEGGRYVSPAGTPFAQRGLPFTAARKHYGAYEVVKPIEVEAGVAAPAFGQPGLGVQYVLPGSVGDLIRAGVLRRVP